MYDFVSSRCCFAEDGKEMDKDSKRTCRTIVLLIKPFVWRRSRCRRRRGLLKLPNFRTKQNATEQHSTVSGAAAYANACALVKTSL